ncbi:hypothetical protein FRB99_000691 [Tulasnella sp. 403]|nr:hypothetical protein FRB99_000691 [Tulasnella sp. 403]
MQRTEKEDASIRLWDLHTQKLIATYEGHTSETWALDISPDDKFVVTGSYDRSIRVWSTGDKDTKPLATHKTDEDVAFLNIHPSLTATAVSLWRNKIQLMDIIKGTTIATLDRPDGYDSYWVLRFSSDSQILYGATVSGEICYWEVADFLRPMESPTEDRLLPYNKLVESGGDGAEAITASGSWVIYISGSGRVSAINLKSSSKSPETIGTVNTVPDSNRADMTQPNVNVVGL